MSKPATKAAGKIGQPKPAKAYTYLAAGISKIGRSAGFRKRALKVALGAKGKQTPKKAVKSGLPKILSKFYSADDVKKALPSRKSVQHAPSIKAGYAKGQVLIMLAGRFKGKRVIMLGTTKTGLLIVCGPFKLNGVPLRRVNQAYTIATSTKVDVSGVNVDQFDDAFFTKSAKAEKKSGDFLGGKTKKAELPADVKAKLQTVDAAVCAAVAKAGPVIKAYLKTRFTLNQHDFPHALKF